MDLVMDLSRHGVIEASAGTGKTHALEQLVVRLLMEEKASLDQILVVTFTEKATGELKGRLRTTLERKAAEHPERLDLEEAVDGFDQASIFTIHGFCQRMLSELAFEQGEAFYPELVNDAELIEPCFREIQRTQWRKEYGQDLAEVLELSGYCQPRGGGAAWEKELMRLAVAFRPACEHQLLPEKLPDWPECIHALQSEVREVHVRVRDQAGVKSTESWENHPWYEGYGQLPFHATNRNAWRRDILRPLLCWLHDTVNERPLWSFLRLLEQCRESGVFAAGGFSALCSKPSAKAQKELDRLRPHLRTCADWLDQFVQHRDWDVIRYQLLLSTLQQLQAAIARIKNERGWQSFDDMLLRLRDGLDPAKNSSAPQLADAIRQRYRYAIVDEFQDTDLVQWEIFKRIFVKGPGPQRLFVVGDPKQAIFGFRGADVETYHQAARELRDEFSAQQQALVENWRSVPQLLDALNELFDRGAWFAGTGIEYRRVCPPEAGARAQIVNDRTGRAALTLLDLRQEEKVVSARRRAAEMIAGEIDRLRCDPGMLEVKLKDTVRPIALDDIGILVFKRTEATPVAEALRRRGIPFAFYKQPGLWQSDEAAHLAYLFQALAQPDDARSLRLAFLTCFFGAAWEELARCEEIPPEHAGAERFRHWTELARSGRWSDFFRSIVYESGVLYRTGPADFDRRRANLLHLTQHLERDAYAKQLDLVGIIRTMNEQRRLPDTVETGMQPIETLEPKVRIMTVHTSKGQEFPIVFVAGGYTGAATDSFLTYRDAQKHLVLDVRKDKPEKQRHEKERVSQERRLLYVALTRAHFKLYVPLVNMEASFSKTGPLGNIFARAVADSQLDQGAPGLIGVLAEPPARADAALFPELVRSSGQPFAVEGPLFPKLPPDLHERRVHLLSFSRLRHRWEPERVQYGDEAEREADDDSETPEEPEPLRGRLFGDMVHRVLEAVPYDEVAAAPAPEALLEKGQTSNALIDKEVQQNLGRMWSRVPPQALAEQCRREIAQLVWTGLKTPLAVLGGPICSIPSSDRLAELQFEFPEKERRMFLGFMDLLIRKDGRYFLVDWKTNVLSSGYGPAALARVMQEQDYIRQFRLYLHALARWLKWQSRQSFDAERQLAGVYYLFLRGMNGHDETNGVFFHQPRAADYDLQLVMSR
jgi:exodeoxyribonuclease V beta subunit